MTTVFLTPPEIILYLTLLLLLGVLLGMFPGIVLGKQRERSRAIKNLMEDAKNLLGMNFPERALGILEAIMSALFSNEDELRKFLSEDRQNTFTNLYAEVKKALREKGIKKNGFLSETELRKRIEHIREQTEPPPNWDPEAIVGALMSSFEENPH